MGDVESLLNQLIDEAYKDLPQALEEIISQSYSATEDNAIFNGRSSLKLNESHRLACVSFAQVLFRKYFSLDNEQKKTICLSSKRGFSRRAK